MCVSYIFTKIYMYIHTHVFSNLSGVGDWVIVAPIVDDIFRVKRVQIGIWSVLPQVLAFHSADDLCVFTADTLVFDNHHQLHFLDEYWAPILVFGQVFKSCTFWFNNRALFGLFRGLAFDFVAIEVRGQPSVRDWVLHEVSWRTIGSSTVLLPPERKNISNIWIYLKYLKISKNI